MKLASFVMIRQKLFYRAVDAQLCTILHNCV
jgi:hypothetical protein